MSAQGGAIDSRKVGRANILRQLLWSMELMRQSLQAELEALETGQPAPHITPEELMTLKHLPMSPEEFRRQYMGDWLTEDPETKRERIRQNVRSRLEPGEGHTL